MAKLGTVWSHKYTKLWLYIVGFMILGFALRLSGAIMFPSTERPDEIYQNLEPAYRLWTGDGVVTWEWRNGIRSWLFPGTLGMIMHLTDVMHLSNDVAIPLVWAAMSIVSCGIIVSGVCIGWRWFGVSGAVISGLLTTLWPDLIYFGPKTLGEVQSGHLLVIAAALSSSPIARKNIAKLTAGLLLGASFDLRFQLIAPILIVLVWNLKSINRVNFAFLVIGFLIPLSILGIVDWWTLGSPFQSVWKNIEVNLLEHKAAEYGTTPIYDYIKLIISRNGPITILLLIFFLYGFLFEPLLGLTAISAVVFHSLISHKEISFIYTALPAAIIVVSVGASQVMFIISRALKYPTTKRRMLFIAILLCIAVTGSLALSERPFVMPARAAAIQALVKDVRLKRDLCGLVFTGWFGTIPWAETGGYVSLQRKVPIYLASSASSLLQAKMSYNYAIGPLSVASVMVGFSIDHCTHDYCLYHQNVECNHDLDHEISRELIKRNQ